MPKMQKPVLEPTSPEAEEWRPIPDPRFAETHEVSNLGIIRRAKDKKIVGQTKLPNGYMRVTLTTERCDFLVHRLVVKAFLPATEDKNAYTVNHIDGVKDHNHLTNLEWATPQQQSLHAVRMGLFNPAKNAKRVLIDTQVQCIRQLARGGVSGMRLSKMFGVSFSLIYKLLKGRNRASDNSIVKMDNYARGHRAARSRLTAENVQEIRALFKAGKGLSEVGRMFGVGHGTIRHIVTGQSWKHLPEEEDK